MAIASRDELHALIEQLPDSELHTVELFVRFVHAQGQRRDGYGTRFAGRRASDDRVIVMDADEDDPIARALANAPEDDEPRTAEEDADAEAGWQAYRRGEYVSHEDVRREIGW